MKQGSKSSRLNSNDRRLRVESLEDRRMLAVLTVQNNFDDSLANLAGDGQLSLREAIAVANNPGTVIDGFVSNDLADDIRFDFGHDGPEIILLQDGELWITSDLTTTGDGPDLLTIDAGNGADGIFSTGDGTRVITVDDQNSSTLLEVTISNVKLTGGDVKTFRTIGGVANAEKLTIESAVISGNSTLGFPGNGGGVGSYGGELTIRNSLIEENYASSGGGGVYASDAILTITSSVIRNNDSDRLGGGVFAERSMTRIEDSLLEGNYARQRGGAIASREFGGTTLILNSTISGNTSSRGGAISEYSGTTTISHSTVAFNLTSNEATVVANYDNFVTIIIIDHSIIARNMDLAGNPFPDIKLAFNPSLSDFQVSYSLIQDPTDVTIPAGGNITGLDPLLGPLANNGGPTKTHALLPGSPVLDAGDPSLSFDPNEFDQRGNPFARVAVGVLTGVPPTPRIDIGSYEAQAPPSADFNNDLLVDGRDFLSWQRSYGAVGPAASGGDSDYDGDADASDLAAWQVSYGDIIVLPPITAALEAVEAKPTSIAAALDAALTLEMFDSPTGDAEYLIDELTPAELPRDTYFARSDYLPPATRNSSSAPYEVQPRNLEQVELETGLTEFVVEAWDD